MPITRLPTAERLYCATGRASSAYRSSTIERRRGISRQGLPEHRHALMMHGLGLSMYCEPFIQRHEELEARGMKPMQIRVALARHVRRLAHVMTSTQDEFDEQRHRQNRHQTGR